MFHAQFDLEKNGYASHEEWLKAWQQTRAKELFFLGSKDETAGNQTCTAALQPDGTLQLRIRLPDALFKNHGKYLLIPGVNFNYGREEILKLLSSQQSAQAISWRLLLDKKDWRLFTTFDVQPIACTSNQDTGVIGLDINANHFALVETDRSGNPISKKVIPLNLYGKSSDQTRAAIGDATASVIAYADNAHKPLIFEDLDFQRKKAELREKNQGSYARMLSSFAYGSIITHLKSRASKKGVFRGNCKTPHPRKTALLAAVAAVLPLTKETIGFEDEFDFSYEDCWPGNGFTGYIREGV